MSGKSSLTYITKQQRSLQQESLASTSQMNIDCFVETTVYLHMSKYAPQLQEDLMIIAQSQAGAVT